MKKIILLICIWLPAVLCAQVTITPQFPLTGFVKQDQLWNILILNPAYEFQARLELVLRDESGELIMSCSSAPFILNKGVKRIMITDVQPVQNNMSSASIAGEFIPPGNYLACYELYDLRKNVSISVRECHPLRIDPLQPPLLNTPGNKSEIITPNPQFTWLPPMPLKMFDDLSYEIILTEMTSNQSAEEAIQFNYPLYSRALLTQPMDYFAPGSGKLTPGKTYAWQVIASNGKSYRVKTEAWQFTVVTDSVERIISLAPFVKLEKDASEISVAHQGFLKMELQNNSSDTSGLFIVRNTKKNKEEKPELEFNIDLSKGVNHLIYNMSKHRRLNPGDVYEVEYINRNNQSAFMRFVPVYYR